MKTLARIACLLALTSASTVAAQDTPSKEFGIFGSEQEYAQFIGDAKRIAYGPEGNAELQAMIPMINDLALNQPIGTTSAQYGVEGTSLGMLSDKNVRAELEMVDSQYEELKRNEAQIQNQLAEQLRALDFTDASQAMIRIKELRERAQNDLESILLPHQLERIRQLRMQAQLRGKTLAELLTSEPLRSQLELNDREAEDLRRSEKEILEELERKMEKLRFEAREKLISNLRPKQQQQVKDLLGEPFRMPAAVTSPKNKKRTSKERNSKKR